MVSEGIEELSRRQRGGQPSLIQILTAGSLNPLYHIPHPNKMLEKGTSTYNTSSFKEIIEKKANFYTLRIKNILFWVLFFFFLSHTGWYLSDKIILCTANNYIQCIKILTTEFSFNIYSKILCILAQNSMNFYFVMKKKCIFL